MTFDLIDQAFKLFQKCYRLSEDDPRNMRLHRLADRTWQRYKRRLIILDKSHLTRSSRFD